jgi:hypothetical protein
MMNIVNLLIMNIEKKERKNYLSKIITIIINIVHLDLKKEQKKELNIFITKKTLGALKELNNRVHWEPRQGTQEEGIKYCWKGNQTKRAWKKWHDPVWNTFNEGDPLPLEFGTKDHQGKKIEDLDGIRELAFTEGMRAIVRFANPNQIKVAEKFLTYWEEPRNWAMCIYWIYGGRGLGKTEYASGKKLEPKVDYYEKTNNKKWWNGYDAHEIVIMDDFRSWWYPFTELLNMLDRVGFTVENKGGERELKPKYFVITTNKAPWDAYQKNDEDIEQLIRRIYDNKGCVIQGINCDDTSCRHLKGCGVFSSYELETALTWQEVAGSTFYL